MSCKITQGFNYQELDVFPTLIPHLQNLSDLLAALTSSLSDAFFGTIGAEYPATCCCWLTLHLFLCFIILLGKSVGDDENNYMLP